MFFENGIYLLAIPLVLLATGYLAATDIKNQRKIETSLNIKYKNIIAKSLVKFMLAFVLLSSLVFLLAGPSSFRDSSYTGKKLAFLFDNTKSMDARASLDSPSRIERSREIALEISGAVYPVEVSMCTFGSVVNCLVPLYSATEDRKIIKTVIEDFVSTNQLFGSGSDIEGSMASFAEDIKKEYGDDKDKYPVTVIFTDGEQTISSDNAENILRITNSGAKFVIIGVGEREGALIPIFNHEGQFFGRYEQFDGGDYISFLEESRLSAIAINSSAEYFFEKEAGLAVRRISQLLRDVEIEESHEGRAESISEFFAIPVMLLSLFFIGRFII